MTAEYVRIGAARSRWRRPLWHIVYHPPRGLTAFGEVTYCSRLIPDNAERGAWDTVREHLLCAVCRKRAALHAWLDEVADQERQARRAARS